MEERKVKIEKFIDDFKKLIKDHKVSIFYLDNYDGKEEFINTSHSFEVDGFLIDKELHEFLFEDINVKRTGNY